MNPQPFPDAAQPRRATAFVPYATYGLILANLAVFLVSGFRGGVIDTSGQLLHQMGSLFAPDVWNGQWWRLFTAMFLHGGLMHIGFNMYVLYQIGPP